MCVLWTRTRFGLVVFDPRTGLQLCKELSKSCTGYRVTVTVTNITVFPLYLGSTMIFFFSFVHLCICSCTFLLDWVCTYIPVDTRSYSLDRAASLSLYSQSIFFLPELGKLRTFLTVFLKTLVSYFSHKNPLRFIFLAIPSTVSSTPRLGRYDLRPIRWLTYDTEKVFRQGHAVFSLQGHPEITFVAVPVHSVVTPHSPPRCVSTSKICS